MNGKPPKGVRVKPQVKNPGKLFKRLLGYVFKKYPASCMIVFVCIVISVFASIQGTMFLRTLIDDYIVPLIGAQSPDFDPLLKAIIRVACIYIIGAAASYVHGRILVKVSQGTLRDLRNDMFNHMQSLPIKYFDTHSHGDIMSIYTNDIDTLRQVISQSLPQIINSLFTIVSVFVCMLILNIPLTIVTLLMVGIMLFVTKKVAAQSGKYFAAQQKNLGTINGYIEEMINGQKVVKVFNYEKRNVEKFNALNGELFDSAYNANKFANILGPVNNQLGHMSYVVCAIVGGILAIKISGPFALSLGNLASFLTFNRNFSMPINQVSQQFNSIIMALAGAERVFGLLDEKSEDDEGYVTLVRAKEIDGKLTETSERTGMWAWKHVHQADGSVEYKKLEGSVVFDDVDFGYNEEKMV
ncbi:MAG: ABC transporter ATP-binding protein, partial [Clostridia bacterium]|nr:ABC transporter ATP-binding protein [Clostridia bacterium]